MPVYNGETYLKEAIDSILSQSFQQFELLIINDGSTDTSLSIINSYKDPRIRLDDNGHNRGIIYSLNKGLSLAQGKYIARMDCDDIALPLRLEKQFNYMESNPEIGICGTSFKAFDELTGWNNKVKFPMKDEAIRAFMFIQSPFCHPSVMIRKEIIDNFSLQYPSNWHCAEDYGLWVELMRYTKGHNMPEILLKYRYHNSSETKKSEKQPLKRNKTTGDIRKYYLNIQGLFPDKNILNIYNQFVDRSLPCNFTWEEQEKLTYFIQIIISDLKKRSTSLAYEFEKLITKTCFYRFISQKSFPKNNSLRNYFFKGAFYYSLSFLTHEKK